ncbi:hypothetical protein ASG35_13595 [Burkholderia sp. Leaf177]|uniref:BrnT family toxin n=1 Tax=Burkholderia sp. Leaf177 TaxID=1736287 RepID=UPI0006FE0CE2|nr:BrnT family toxin [Burkholderia sp. Leaf177]KQR76156.1 hypothetical protein ASG35_13595 [Burkholderia sp. Leaf177]
MKQYVMFDLEKDVSNRRKHGLSLADAGLLDWNELRIRADTRRDYREERLVGHGLLHQRLHCVVFTPRDGAVRVISFRRANNREIKEYEQD